MFKLQEETLESFLYKAKEQLEEKGGTLFVSWTEAIAPVTMLHVFNMAKNNGMHRQFWTNSGKDFSIVGIGTAKTIVGEGNEFDSLEKKWQQLQNESWTNDPYKNVGTGIIALGGMDFDPLKEKTNLWKQYSSNSLTLPKMAVVHQGSNYYVTHQLELDIETNIEKELHKINHMSTFLEGQALKEHVDQAIIAEKEIDPEGWKNSVLDAVQAIENGEAKKIVLAREKRIRLNQRANIAWMIQQLLKTQPNSYVFAIEADEDNCFIGATPERLVLVDGEEVLSTCLAGTAPRGKSKEEDNQIANHLLHDPKNREEHDYVVQMIRDSMQDDCYDVDIPHEPIVWTLRNLQHLYTPVSAKLKNGSSIFRLVEKLHPTPALGGLPKEAALQYIREHEQLDRGWYGAPIGWIDGNDNGEFAVAIRSGLVQGSEISLFAGCGVMKDSDPEMEYEETGVKFLPMYNVLEEKNGTY